MNTKRPPSRAGSGNRFTNPILTLKYAINDNNGKIPDETVFVINWKIPTGPLKSSIWTDESVNKKLHQAFNHGLKPILCVGESLEQRESGKTNELLRSQLEKDLAGLTSEQVKELVIAYEPIWAIGTGKTATADVADETCGFIRETVGNLYDQATSEAIRIQYGGSVKTSNIDELMAKPNIDGALIGGASLKPEDFITLVKAAVK